MWSYQMTLKTTVSIAALGLVFGVGTPVMAQTTTPTQRAPVEAPPKTPVSGQIVMQEPNTLLAKQDLIGQTVYAPDKAKIGTISDLLLSKEAKTVEGFVIGVGGFLGLGEKSVALKMDKLKMTSTAEGMQLTMDMTKEELTNTPTFKSKKDQDAEKAAAERRTETPQQRPPVTK
jgi:Zn finger protein HypA/HybF involved in hydrogenase expression